MERIKNVMQRLQELYYSQHQKTSIDIDLMLDYTRVMYADLLEWRKEFKDEPTTTETAEKNEDIRTSQVDSEANTSNNPQQNKEDDTPQTDSAPESEEQTEKDGNTAKAEITNGEEPSRNETVAEQDEKEDEDINTEENDKDLTVDKEDAETEADESEKEDNVETQEEEKQATDKEEVDDEPPVEEQVEADVQDENDLTSPSKQGKTPEAEEGGDVKAESKQLAADNPQFYLPIERDEPAPKQPMQEESAAVISATPEAERLDTVQSNFIGISFEPPAPAEKTKEIKDELSIEEASVNTTVEATPVAVPEAVSLPEIKPYERIELTVPPVEQFVAPPARKDIRTAIGINDKYLFLNELFNHHKTDYEETLDAINKMDDYKQAADWVKNKVAKEHKWDKDDDTAESFYAMLEKHFSSR